jgi:hypothetical protein
MPPWNPPVVPPVVVLLILVELELEGDSALAGMARPTITPRPIRLVRAVVAVRDLRIAFSFAGCGRIPQSQVGVLGGAAPCRKRASGR